MAQTSCSRLQALAMGVKGGISDGGVALFQASEALFPHPNACTSLDLPRGLLCRCRCPEPYTDRLIMLCAMPVQAVSLLTALTRLHVGSADFDLSRVHTLPRCEQLAQLRCGSLVKLDMQLQQVRARP